MTRLSFRWTISWYLKWLLKCRNAGQLGRQSVACWLGHTSRMGLLPVVSSYLPRSKTRWATATTSGGLAIGHVFGRPRTPLNALTPGNECTERHVLICVEAYSIIFLLLKKESFMTYRLMPSQYNYLDLTLAIAKSYWYKCFTIKMIFEGIE